MTAIMKLNETVDLTDVKRPIVMVDDEPLDYITASRYHKKSDIDNPFIHFENGELFLNYLAEVKRGEKMLPALVLMDINMPCLNGFEVVETMRQDEFFNDVPVVTMLTSSTDSADKQRAQESGIQNFLVKPFDPKAYAEFFGSLAA